MKGVRHSFAVAVAMLLALSVGCDFIRGTRPRQPVPPGIDLEEPLAVRAERWEPADAFREPTPLERTVTARLTAGLGDALASDETACVAREMAAFFGRYRALPDDVLMQWLAGFCAESAAPDSTLWIERDVPANDDPNPLGDVEAALLAELKGRGPGVRFGVGTHLRASKLVIVFTATYRDVEVHRLGPNDAGLVRLEGRLLVDADDVRAVINRGVTGTARCSRDKTVELPAFDVTCQMAPDDEQAYIDVISSKGRMLEGPVGQVLARRPQARAYLRPIVRLPRRTSSTTALVDGINVLRAQAGLDALRLEPAEMKLLGSLYPSAFRAELEDDFEIVRRFEDEVMAGRAIAGVIRWAETMRQIARAGNASDWLVKVLSRPAYREALFQPRAERVAIMTHDEPTVGFGAAIATYSLFRDSDDTERATLVYDTLERLRARHGRATSKLETPEELALAARRVRDEQVPPDDALKSTLAALNAHSTRTFTGVWFRIPWNADPENLPDALLEAPELGCAVVATHRKPPDHAWGEQIVFVVYPLTGKPA